MPNIINSIVKKLTTPVLRRKVKVYFRLVNRFRNTEGFLSVLVKSKVVTPNVDMSHLDDYVRQFDIIYSKINIETNNYYIYPYNPLIERFQFLPAKCGNIPVDFSQVLNSDLNNLYEVLQKCSDSKFKSRELKLIDSIKYVGQRIAKQLNKSHTARNKELLSFFPDLLYRKPKSFDEALQKILFYDALFWQMGHYHIGLGRLDLILSEYFENDLHSNRCTEKDLVNKIERFILTLGKDTIAKSLALIGDTGQYILLGGVDKNGKNVDNRLTELFLEAFTKLRIPDPKLILRVNTNTPNFVWNKSIHCIMTGIGSPLLMCEDIIMQKMVEFGYDKRDVWNLGTSACWEPLIIGKSFDINNPFRSVVAIKPLNDLILRNIKPANFEEFYSQFKLEYKKELESIVHDIEFDGSPLYTLFSEDCIQRERDFTQGGVPYSYHGIQVVSFPNTINALLNIKRLVFDENKYSLEDCCKAIVSNYKDYEDLRVILSETGQKFGSTDVNVVNLTNDLIGYTGEITKTLRCNGNPIKVGFSSPNYITQSKEVDASLDGRRHGDPFAVHISPISSKISISEILEFSAKLKYSDNCINGNVVDFILPSSYIKQPEKLVGILKDACEKGIFELQLNVMDKATLIDAKAHPEKYPNLIVRVWGFSAYFNDLPDDFKDNLIRRAEIYEAA